MNIAVYSARPELEATVAHWDRMVALTERTHARAKNAASARFVMQARCKRSLARRNVMLYRITLVLSGHPE